MVIFLKSFGQRKIRAYCKILGEEHPDTLTSLNNLAITYGDIGEHHKEVELEEKVYALQCKVLEEEHPELKIMWEEELSQIRAQLMGDVQIEVLRRMIQDRFGFEVMFNA